MLKKKNNVVHTILLYGVLTIFTAAFVTPFLWMLSGSFKTVDQVFTYPIRWIPKPFVFDNFYRAWISRPFHVYLKNTLIITGANVVGRLLIASFVAFGFAQCKFPGRNVLFVIILASMILPPHTVIVPLFMLFRILGWINTFLPLTVPFILSSPFFIFFMRQFFLGIPNELADAARIDGCSSFIIYWRIFLPLAKPALAALAIFAFMWSWNDFLLPLIVLNEEAKKTLVLGLEALKGQFRVEWNLIMAMTVLITIPCLAVFLLAQKYFVRGITVSGIKG